MEISCLRNISWIEFYSELYLHVICHQLWRISKESDGPHFLCAESERYRRFCESPWRLNRNLCCCQRFDILERTSCIVQGQSGEGLLLNEEDEKSESNIGTRNEKWRQTRSKEVSGLLWWSADLTPRPLANWCGSATAQSGGGICIPATTDM